MWFRILIVSATCAALMGLAASGLVRTHFFDFMSVLARSPYESPAGKSVQADGGAPAAVAPASQGVQPEPISLSLPKVGKARKARRGSSPNPVRDAFSQELDRGIRKLAERRYEISGDTLDFALGNLGQLARLAHVTPDVRDGRPSGFRLSAIKTDGPFAKLGLRNDDVLVSVNGLDITTPDGVLDAYNKLKQARRFTLGLMRAGREIRQEYAIR